MDYLGVKVMDDSNQLGNRLEELFGGVLGHTAECLLGIKQGQTLADFALKLKGGSKGGVLCAFNATSKARGLSLEALCKD
eukprot:scaffold79290_cov41-Attheya_sp.AAC.3